MGYIDTLPRVIAPTAPDLRGRDSSLDEFANEILRRYVRDVSGSVRTEEFDGRFARATLFLLPYLSRVFKGRKLRALEVGCGGGAKAIALAHAFDQYVGVDIVPSVVREATQTAQQIGLKNAHFEAVEAANLGSYLASQDKKFDLIILYAVLEHLTVDEKIDLLSLCWDYLDDDGHLFIGEAPNRMVPTDFHSSKLLYFQQMPLAMWRKYYLNSPNDNWRKALSATKNEEEFEHTAFRRGIHIGHQEFELGLKSIADIGEHMLSDNYSVEMLNLYPYTSVEFLKLIELDQLTQFAPGVKLVPVSFPRIFGRYYVETLLCKKPLPKALQRNLRVVAIGESGALYNRPLSTGLVLAPGATYAIEADLLPDGTGDEVDVNLSFHRPADCGVLQVIGSDGSRIAEIQVAETMNTIGKWRANLAIAIPTVSASQFPLTLRAAGPVPVKISYAFLQR